jgi:hypothetical protein
MRMIGLAVVLAVALNLAPIAAEAQQMQKQKAAKIGFLLGGTASSPAVQIEPFKNDGKRSGAFGLVEIGLDPQAAARIDDLGVCRRRPDDPRHRRHAEHDARREDQPPRLAAAAPAH